MYVFLRNIPDLHTFTLTAWVAIETKRSHGDNKKHFYTFTLTAWVAIETQKGREILLTCYKYLYINCLSGNWDDISVMLDTSMSLYLYINCLSGNWDLRFVLLCQFLFVYLYINCLSGNWDTTFFSYFSVFLIPLH